MHSHLARYKCRKEHRFILTAMAAVCSALVAWSPVLAAESLIEATSRKMRVDLPQMREARIIRVLVNYSRTNFFYDNRQLRGFEYELMQAYQKFLNKGLKKHKEGIRLVYIPVRFDQLLNALTEGRGDIAASGLTITPMRAEKVAFTTPYMPDVSEVVVTGKSVKGVRRLEDLAGRTVTVRKGSSYVEHLKAFNMLRGGKKATRITIQEIDPHLVTEDILEMVNAGLVDISIADNHIAGAWGRVLPNLVVREDLVLKSGGAIAWAVRKDSPELLNSLNTFIAKHRLGTLLGNIIYKRYYESDRWIKNALAGTATKRLEKVFPLFVKYGETYNFDPLILAALGFQESGLDNNLKSHRGAVGIMQIKPSTAADKNVTINNIQILENNIHAGTKYLAFIRERYFSGGDIEPTDRVYFSLAAYNAGPARVSQLRRQAAAKGFDPNKWFANVEVVAAQRIGRETVTYVANISKYYVTYRIGKDLWRERMKSKEEVLERN